MRNADVSRIDRAMQKIAGIPPGKPRKSSRSPALSCDVTEIYDETVSDLAPRIAQEVLTRFPEAVNRVLLAGGGAYHLREALIEHLAPLELSSCPTRNSPTCSAASPC